MWQTYSERSVDLNNQDEIKHIVKFMDQFNLTFDANVSYTVALFDDDNNIVASGSRTGKVLRNIAILEKLQGEGLTAKVVTHLIKEASSQGIYHYFIYTKSDKSHLFMDLGFKEIMNIKNQVALLESGLNSIEGYLTKQKEAVKDLPRGKRASLVMNCNPFTLGHKAVIKKASEENASVVILVVSEDKSLFPLQVRLKLIKEGLTEFNNVKVIEGGDYIISAATFPGYFTKGKDTVIAQTNLDAKIFGTYIAPALNITSRYVGDEPYCEVTRAYNEALNNILPLFGIEVKIMERIGEQGVPISASLVREYLYDSRWEDLKKIVPPSTYAFLKSEPAKPIIEKIKTAISRH